MDRQSKIERSLKKKYKSKFEPKDFREKDTIRKVIIQWNKLSTAQKNRLSIEELDYILDQAEVNVRSGLFEEAGRIYNRKKSQEYKHLTPTQKGQRTKEANKQLKEEVKTLQIKEVIQKSGIPANRGNQLTYKVGKETIPNPNMIDKTYDEILEDRLDNNRILPKNRRKDSAYIIHKTKEEYDEFKKAVKEYGGKDVEKRLRSIDRQSLKDVNNMLYGYIDETGQKRGGYFKHGIEEINKEIDAYVKQLSPLQRYQFMQMLTSDKFMQIWCSDQDSDCYNDDWLINRQADALKVLRNETGKSIYMDKLGRRRFKKDKNPSKSNHYTISNFI